MLANSQHHQHQHQQLQLQHHQPTRPSGLASGLSSPTRSIIKVKSAARHMGDEGESGGEENKASDGAADVDEDQHEGQGDAQHKRQRLHQDHDESRRLRGAAARVPSGQQPQAHYALAGVGSAFPNQNAGFNKLSMWPNGAGAVSFTLCANARFPSLFPRSLVLFGSLRSYAWISPLSPSPLSLHFSCVASRSRCAHGNGNGRALGRLIAGCASQNAECAADGLNTAAHGYAAALGRNTAE